MARLAKRHFTPEQKAQICAEFMAAKNRTAQGTRPGLIAAVCRRYGVQASQIQKWADDGGKTEIVSKDEAGDLLSLMVAATEAGVIEEDQADRILGLAVRRGWI